MARSGIKSAPTARLGLNDVRLQKTYPLNLGLGSLSVLEVLAVRLECADDVKRRAIATLSGLDRSSVNHESRSVQSTEGLSGDCRIGSMLSAQEDIQDITHLLLVFSTTYHQGTRHVLVTSGNDNHTIEPVSSSGGLDLVSDKVSRLKLIRDEVTE